MISFYEDFAVDGLYHVTIQWCDLQFAKKEIEWNRIIFFISCATVKYLPG